MPRKQKKAESSVEATASSAGEAPIEASLQTPVQKPVEEHHDIFRQEGELVCDVFENGKEFVVLAAIAGVAIKDLDISVEKDMMVIKGTRTSPHAHPDNKFFYQECWWGPFSKKIVLPENIDTENADAQMDKGILTVRIPKLSEGELKEESQQVELS
jgi:HSP20 family protein